MRLADLSWRRQKIRLIAMGCLLLAAIVNTSCANTATFDRQLDLIAGPYKFSIALWELNAIPRAVYEVVSNNRAPVDDEVETVMRYFSITGQISRLELEINSGSGEEGLAALQAELEELQQQKTELTGTVERIIGRQIREALVAEGIYNPMLGVNINFPPLSFVLEEPPLLLVVSPRDRIESTWEITLKPGTSLEEIENIEADVDGLDVSSLVVELGGFGGTFPNFVSDRGSLKFTVETAAEEWLHQYLVFTPLGFSYLLDATGISPNYEIATINETVAGMISEEIGARVLAKYYPDYGTAQGDEEFNRQMREIRRAVDDYLARGEIEPAEAFMEERRQHLESRGYYIRKLNQAYFAFYGTYADSPTSISSIGAEMRELRERSTSLKDFLDTASGINSRKDLQRSIEQAARE
jgi:predicted  nucleic acid-binding Zn-ribbon protein